MISSAIVSLAHDHLHPGDDRQFDNQGHPRFDSDCTHIVLIEWEDGQRSWEDARMFDNDVHEVTVAAYARENGLLHDKFWSRFRHLASREKKTRRMIKQAQLHSHRTAIKYKFGVKVPRNHDQAMEFDTENKNDNWSRAEKLEVHELRSLNSFASLGCRAKKPRGHSHTPVFFVCDVNCSSQSFIGVETRAMLFP